jgi:hypothetical protein
VRVVVHLHHPFHAFQHVVEQIVDATAAALAASHVQRQVQRQRQRRRRGGGGFGGRRPEEPSRGADVGGHEGRAARVRHGRREVQLGQREAFWRGELGLRELSGGVREGSVQRHRRRRVVVGRGAVRVRR